ncbi:MULTISPECIES: ATP-binding protein [unclassified Halorhabdus]|uniref:ATP-binding protein n=1 Tax=unclassified Halorhabdus TaxID=2621901 RepID=UPI0012B2B44D|nr:MULTISPECIES: ATP-binding protein [unclassified Halorhabdus]
MNQEPTVLLVGASDEAAPLTRALSPDDNFYRVEHVETGRQARRAVDESVCCVVADQELPASRGVDLARKLAETAIEPPVVINAETLDPELVAATGGPVTAVVPPSHRETLPETVRTQVEAHLQSFEETLKTDAIETLFENLEYTVMVKDDQARFLQLFSGLTGPSDQEARGRTDRELYAGRFNLGEQWYADDMQVLGGDPIHQEVKQYGEESPFWIEYTKLPWRDETGDIRGLVGFSQQVTDRVRLKQQLARQSKRLEAFSDYIAHDLKSPLQVASGHLDLARDGQEASFAEVQGALDRMDRMIDDIKILARREREDQLRLHEVPIVEPIRTIWENLETGEATLELELPQDMYINAAKGEFRPLLENLLRNAIDHGGSDVTVTVGPLNAGFFLEDDGPGIPPDDRDAIFEHGHTTADDGSGIGLAMVQDVVDSHDWTIEVCDSSEGGARFEITNVLSVTEPDRNVQTGESVSLTTATDVGNPVSAGDAIYDPNAQTWSITGAGADISGPENEFHYVFTRVAGDARIQAHVADLEAVGPYSKGGVMVRNSLDEDSLHGFVGRTAEHGTELLWCDRPGTKTTSQHLEEANDDYEWLRIDREGDVLTCSVSRDGATWNLIDQRHVPLAKEVLVGLATCSAVARRATTATFEDVTVRRIDTDAPS